MMDCFFGREAVLSTAEVVGVLLVSVILSFRGTGGGDLMPVTVAARPDTLPQAVQARMSLYRLPPDSGAVASLVARTSRTQRDTSYETSMAIASLWRAAGEFDLALQLLDSASASRGFAGAVELERARILLGRAAESGDADDRAQGEIAYWNACDQIDASLKREIWIDLRGLATPEEQAEWKVLPADSKTCEWTRHFWAERAWRMGTGVADRLVVHYRRLAEARRRYGIPQNRYLRGPSYYRGRPDSLAVDDRGLVFLRMGEPEHIEYHPIAEDKPGLTEHWAYARTDGYWLYYFVPGVPAIDYVLEESFGPLALPGNDYFQRFVTGMALDPLYAKRQVFGSLSLGERRMALRQIQLQAREFQRRVVTEVPDTPELRPTLDFLVEPLRFWNPASGGNTVWLVASARASDLTAIEKGGYRIYSLSARIAYLDDGEVHTTESDREVRSTGRLSDEDGIDVALAVHVAPGRYPFTLSLSDSQSAQLGGNWLQDTITVPDYGSSLPAVSDIAVARDSGGSWSRDGLTFLRVTPAHVTNADGSVHVYFEVYGVSPGSPYEVELRILPADDARHAYDVQETDLVFRLRYPTEMPMGTSSFGAHHLRLDLSSTEQNEYILQVRVTDLGRSIHSLPSTTRLTVR